MDAKSAPTGSLENREERGFPQRPQPSSSYYQDSHEKTGAGPSASGKRREFVSFSRLLTVNGQKAIRQRVSRRPREGWAAVRAQAPRAITLYIEKSSEKKPSFSARGHALASAGKVCGIRLRRWNDSHSRPPSAWPNARHQRPRKLGDARSDPASPPRSVRRTPEIDLV